MTDEVDVIGCPEVLLPLIDYLEQLTEPAGLGPLEAMLESMQMSREDFGSYCSFDPRKYKRNYIARSKWFDLILLCWRPGQRSPIHDHVGSACAFRVIEGTGSETRFEQAIGDTRVTATETHEMPTGYICAAYDDDIHEVANRTDDDLITLHAYSPRLKMTTYPRPVGVS